MSLAPQPETLQSPPVTVQRIVRPNFAFIGGKAGPAYISKDEAFKPEGKRAIMTETTITDSTNGFQYFFSPKMQFSYSSTGESGTYGERSQMRKRVGDKMVIVQLNEIPPRISEYQIIGNSFNLEKGNSRFLTSEEADGYFDKASELIKQAKEEVSKHVQNSSPEISGDFFQELLTSLSFYKNTSLSKPIPQTEKVS